MILKRSLADFLARNPFERGWTDGLFYREKMRAIHEIGPAQLPEGARILEIGGGRSGLARNLYPEAHVTTVDIDPGLVADHVADDLSAFVLGDARALPFADRSFDLVTMFDVLEHIEGDRKAAEEALRVVKPQGWILVSTPYDDWHYPHYGFMQRFCPPERALMDEWGHVRRGYTSEEVAGLFGRRADRNANFINPVTAFYHDVAFSRLRRRTRRLIYLATAVPVLAAYALHRPSTKGSEMACAWQVSGVSGRIASEAAAALEDQ
jgi:ubiquinone/menaquinone biosynthesis C-methylase UbiE